MRFMQVRYSCLLCSYSWYVLCIMYNYRQICMCVRTYVYLDLPYSFEIKWTNIFELHKNFICSNVGDLTLQSHENNNLDTCT